MDSIELAELALDEKRSFQYLCDKLDGLSCPLCGCKKFYCMSRQRLRCAHCRKDLRPLAGTKFSEIRIPASKWLCLIRLFEFSASARDASGKIGLSYNTTLKAFDTIRMSIIEGLAAQGGALRAEQGRLHPCLRRKGSEKRSDFESRITVFGIREADGRVCVDIVKEITAEEIMKEKVKKTGIGNIICTDRWKGYDSLIFCGYKHLDIPDKLDLRPDDVYINMREGFWSFARKRIIDYHGVSSHKFILYLKEMEWRYNNRNKDVYDMLINYMLHGN